MHQHNFKEFPWGKLTMTNQIAAIVCALILGIGIVLAPVTYLEYKVRLCEAALGQQYKSDQTEAVQVNCVYRLFLK